MEVLTQGLDSNPTRIPGQLLLLLTIMPAASALDLFGGRKLIVGLVLCEKNNLMCCV
jgi:hypothetical protein